MTGLVVGFGATDADWLAHHVPHPSPLFSPGAVYDPDPTLPSIGRATGAKYVLVQHSQGHILGYTVNLHRGTSIDSAKAEALKEVPADATVLWFNVKDSCAQMEIQSATLGKALSDPSIGDADGMVTVELDTEKPDGTAIYDMTNINELLFSLGSYRQPAGAPDC